jgi:K+-sensing histidine kinase KdpD
VLRRPNINIASYGVAFAVVGFAILADVLLKSLIGRTLFFIPLAAIAVTSITSGYGPGVFSVLLSIFALDYFLSAPSWMSSIQSFGFVVRLMIFLPAGMLVAWLGGRLRETSNHLRKVLGELQTEREFREHLIAGFAHDLRNPMTTAKVTIGFVKRKADAKTSAQLGRAFVALERADELVQDFLDVSQAEAGKKILLQKQNCNIVVVLRELLAEYQVTHPNRLRLVVAVEKLPAVLDQRALRRIVDNLISNALKYGDKGTEVLLSLEIVKSGTFSISVHNWGAVLSQELVQNLFCFFERSPQSSNQRGWGLGLAVVKELVDAHQGSIDVKSTDADGTLFTVQLPSSEKIADL